jgi:hypothetical protein
MCAKQNHLNSSKLSGFRGARYFPGSWQSGCCHVIFEVSDATVIPRIVRARFFLSADTDMSKSKLIGGRSAILDPLFTCPSQERNITIFLADAKS